MRAACFSVLLIHSPGSLKGPLVLFYGLCRYYLFMQKDIFDWLSLVVGILGIGKSGINNN